MKKGFTLIELLVVSAIIALLTAVSAAAFNTFSRSQTLTQSAKEVESALKDAQNRALSSVDGQNWGVRLVPGSNLLDLFATPSMGYSDPSARVFDRELPDTVEIFDAAGSLPPGYNFSVVFVVSSGAVGYANDAGTACIGGSDDVSCSFPLGRQDCIVIGVRLQGTSQERYLKVNGRSIFEDDSATSCP